ncbi:hypothetical protein LMG22037_05466 [Paraburkholderia phenoliruptrix]|uniref:Uncharacterized protein n=1 Tax=Paraburkholderia phenoliruptrix TaxID=252970 RepID=A0A6J5C845_9BURK|nr:hypothetical protein [Paraburkholderia phenoliruptrix]CAB3729659.1 hypothetical protein LMG22037_05466 [Paraburkholderia phenoliruptrix]
MKSIFAAALFALPLVAHAEITSETFCFSSGNGKPINFEMRTYYDSASKFSSGFVRYQNSKQPIPLVLANSAEETLNKDAPDQETATWIEIYNGQATGEYEMITQGTEVSSMVYTNKKKNQKTGFMLNTGASGQGGCKW